MPLRGAGFASDADVEGLRQDFHATHEEVFAISDPHSSVEIVSWRARVSCRLGAGTAGRLVESAARHAHAGTRQAYFSESGVVEARVLLFVELAPGEVVEGPAIIESPVTTVVIDPGATVERTPSGSLSIVPAVAPALPVELERATA